MKLWLLIIYDRAFKHLLKKDREAYGGAKDPEDLSDYKDEAGATQDEVDEQVDILSAPKDNGTPRSTQTANSVAGPPAAAPSLEPPAPAAAT